MAMSKKDFIALADVLRATTSSNDAPEARWQWAELRDRLADFCAEQNPQFNRERWLGYIAGSNGSNGRKVKHNT